MPNNFSHIDEAGKAKMVDVGLKPATSRRAIAEGWLMTGTEIIAAINDQATPKGNALETARIAGILGAKETSRLIPLCHPLPIDSIQIDFELFADRIRITATVATVAKTGVEMEAMTAVGVAALTLYDMLKSFSHSIVITDIRLLEKSGGKSGWLTAPTHSHLKEA